MFRMLEFDTIYYAYLNEQPFKYYISILGGVGGLRPCLFCLFRGRVKNWGNPVAENEVNAALENIEEYVVAHESTESGMDNEAQEAEKRFECILCDFHSNWENGVKIHMSRKHGNIEQLEGNIEIEDENSIDEEYERTEHYWEKGWLGRFYQTFLDVSKIIDECHDMPADTKEAERKKVLEARKTALGECYHTYPPWGK